MSKSVTKIIGISRRAYCPLLEIDKGIEQRRANIIGKVNMKICSWKGRFGEGSLSLIQKYKLKRTSWDGIWSAKGVVSTKGGWQIFPILIPSKEGAVTLRIWQRQLTLGGGRFKLGRLTGRPPLSRLSPILACIVPALNPPPICHSLSCSSFSFSSFFSLFSSS